MKPARTIDQIGDDLIEVRKLARLEKRFHGHMHPATRELVMCFLAEYDALKAIESAKAMRPALIVAASKAQPRRFTGEPPTGFGAL